MGSSPSKVQTIQQGQDDNHIKESASDSVINPSFEESAHSPDQHSEEKKEMETISSLSATPRTKVKSTDVQTRVSRQVKEGRDDDNRRARITDDQVHVNLAMADLMAYLQVVANNSNNLPLTRRDDPELNRMVSNLSGEEYARKSAAFIPADVRVIGGSFTKYGRVWDLPTSEEYNAQDGAQEPGRSYGGACCNAMLKVLYDAANEAADAAQAMESSDALFADDDDDDATITGDHPFSRNNTFASIDMNDHCNPSTISWATLLRKMKAEIKDIEYAQVPTLTTTRKLDLNQAFSLVPDAFDPKACKKRSLLVGCNYNHINGAQLKASHDDVRSMKDYIVNVHGFPESKDMMTILLDDDEHQHPTFFNITEAFKRLSEQSQPGDAVFIHFAGHGGRVLDSNDDVEVESYDEVIVPSDYTTSGLIRDTLIFKTLLAPMRYGVTVTVLIDACDTGMVLDLPYSWSTRSDRPESTPKMSPNDDFSFVRFLKVVKTLYESSTFTQLGKTVGSALTTGNLPKDTEDEDDIVNGTSKKSQDGSTEGDVTRTDLESRKNALLSIFCASPAVERLVDKASKKNRRKKTSDQLTFDTRDSRNPSLLEQMLTCTLGHEIDDMDEISEIESYAIKSHSMPSYSEAEVDEESTDGSCGDDTYESAKNRKNSSGRGRSRRRKK